jgi:hypothetical protein
MRTLQTMTRAVALAGLTVLLAACGGGGGGSTSADVGVTNVPGTGVPTSATTSVAGLIAFMRSLIAGTDETSDPVVLGGATLSSSETDDATILP